MTTILSAIGSSKAAIPSAVSAINNSPAVSAINKNKDFITSSGTERTAPSAINKNKNFIASSGTERTAPSAIIKNKDFSYSFCSETCISADSIKNYIDKEVLLPDKNKGYDTGIFFPIGGDSLDCVPSIHIYYGAHISEEMLLSFYPYNPGKNLYARICTLEAMEHIEREYGPLEQLELEVWMDKMSMWYQINKDGDWLAVSVHLDPVKCYGLNETNVRFLEFTFAESFDDLYFGKTSLCNEDSGVGWLSPSGEFTGCGCFDHMVCARYVLKRDYADLETDGYTHISCAPGSFYAGDEYHCCRELTEKQKEFLLERGHKIRNGTSNIPSDPDVYTGEWKDANLYKKRDTTGG